MITVDDKTWYEDKTWLDNLNIYLDAIKDDDDILIIFSGKERSGKSLRMRQVAKYCADYLGTTFNRKNINFDLQKYMDFSIESPPNTVCILDESRNQLSRKKAMSKPVKKFTDYLSECGKYNQVHLIALPAYHDLDRNVVLWRSKFVVKLHKWFEPDDTAKSGFRLSRGRYTLYDNDEYLKKCYEYPYAYPKRWVTKGKYNNVEMLTKQELMDYDTEKSGHIESRYHSKFEEEELKIMEKRWRSRWFGVAQGMKDNRGILNGEIADCSKMDIRTVQSTLQQLNQKQKSNSI